MRGIIYKYTSPINKVYIGQTINEEKRRKCFLRDGRYTKSEGHISKSKIDSARKKYGPENFKYEILFEFICDDSKILKRTLDDLEKFYIKKYDSINKGYNIMEGGSGGSWNRGLTGIYSKETIAKMSLSAKNRPKISKETRKKLSSSHKGQKPTEYQIERARQVNIGNKYGCHKVKYVSNDGDTIIFNSKKELAQYFNVSDSSIYRYIRGERVFKYGTLTVLKNNTKRVPPTNIFGLDNDLK